MIHWIVSYFNYDPFGLWTVIICAQNVESNHYLYCSVPNACADITLGFTGPVSVTEGSNSSVPICVQLLSGSLGRSVTVVAYTMNYTANRKRVLSYDIV